MTVFSKLVCAVAVTEAVYAAPQTRGRKTEAHWQTGMARPFVRTMSFMAPGALASAQATMPSLMENPFSKENELKMKYTMHQAELEGLLEDEDKMVARFEEHMTKRYPKCEKVEVPMIIGGTQTMEHCHPFKYHTDDEESNEKLTNFAANVKTAYNRNLYSDGAVVHGITSLMDLSKDQFMGLMGYNPEASLAKMNAEEKREYLAENMETMDEAPPVLGGKKDWRDAGAITPIKDQSTCGSCWAFSSVETVESAAIIAGASDPKDPFIGSPSQLVDCEKQDFGCIGGLPSNAFKYLHKHPLEEEDKYGPYRPIQRKCKAKKEAGKGPEFEVTKSVKVSIGGKHEGKMKDFILSKGPMSVAVHATSKWQTYVGGIMSYDDCDDAENPNHAVQAVAIDADADTPYWTIRNSWAEGWGEDGFIRLSYGQNTCNLAADVYSVEVEKKGPSNTLVV